MEDTELIEAITLNVGYIHAYVMEKRANSIAAFKLSFILCKQIEIQQLLKISMLVNLA